MRESLPGVMRTGAQSARPQPPLHRREQNAAAPANSAVAVQAPAPPVVQAQKKSAPVALSKFSVGTRLHIGCGALRLKGWINADAVPGVGEVVLDLQDDKALPAATFAEIYGCHVLEHCWPQDTPGILRRLRDALLPGGTLRISVPDIRLVVKNCVDSQAYGDERSALAVIYGGDFSKTTAAPDLHRQTFWLERLERLLKEAGFVNIREWGPGSYPEIDAIGDYATRPSGADGKSLISVNMEANRPRAMPSPSHGRPLSYHHAPFKLPEETTEELSEPTPAAAVPQKTIDVSVLLGTVNRPEMLQQCIESIRASLAGSGLTHEIVVAYGRDNEPTLPWMQKQADVVPVLGGMEGAIEAFNRAYDASRGRLVCQLNDDVLVDGDSIAKAVKYLDADPSCSGVVFRFDRGDGLGYRHEWLGGSSGMSGTPNSEKTLHPNQMVVRRSACEAVIERIGALWGDAERRTDKTYGGDSAFGVLCRHLSLRLDSVDGVSCRDRCGEAHDALRAANAKVDPGHGKRWGALYFPLMMAAAPPGGEEWPRLYAPRWGFRARRSPVEAGRPLRLLHLSLSYDGEPQLALRRALARIGPTVEIPWHKREQELLAAAKAHRPDVVWAQIQSEAWTPEMTETLRAAVGPDCVLCLWTGDVRTSGSQPVEKWFDRAGKQFDIVLSDSLTYSLKLAQDKRTTAACGYLQCGVDLDLNRWDPDAKEAGGVVFLGSPHRQLDGGKNERERLLDSVNRALPGVLTVYGSGWEKSRISGIAKGFIGQEQASKEMRAAAVTISTSLFQDLTRYSSDRLKRAMASGAVTAVHRFPDMKGLGLREGENCLAWSSSGELIELLRKWTRPECADASMKIRKQAAELASRRFTWDIVVEEFLAILRDYRSRKGLK